MFTALFPTHKPSFWSLEKPWCYNKMQIHIPHQPRICQCSQSVNAPQTEIILIDTEYNTETCTLSKVHVYMQFWKERQRIMANVWITTLQAKWVNLGCARCMWSYSYLTNLLVPRCVYTMKTEKESIKIINLLSCAAKKKAKANQVLDCRHPLVPSF